MQPKWWTVRFLAGLLGTVIGLVLDKDKAEDIVPRGIQLKTSVTGKDKLEHGTMFFAMCASGGTIFLALIFTMVILFINDDVDLNTFKYGGDGEEEEEEENGAMDEDGFPAEPKSQRDRKQSHGG